MLTRARLAAHADTRLLDFALLAALAAVLLQILPLPGAIASVLSPHSWPLQAMLHWDPVRAWWPLSIDARLTRAALAGVAAPVLLFWAARQAFSREALLEHVWGFTYGDTATVTVHIRRLREKIERDPSQPTLVTTVWGVGYRFDGTMVDGPRR